MKSPTTVKARLLITGAIIATASFAWPASASADTYDFHCTQYGVGKVCIGQDNDNPLIIRGKFVNNAGGSNTGQFIFREGPFGTTVDCGHWTVAVGATFHCDTNVVGGATSYTFLFEADGGTNYASPTI
jgi:hypothetical protein